LELRYGIYTDSQKRRGDTCDGLSVLLVGDLAHFAETLARTSETVFELKDFDLLREYILA
jgi:hypothetical protein